MLDDYAKRILALSRPMLVRLPQFVCNLMAVGHLPNLPRTAAQKAALITIAVHCSWTLVIGHHHRGALLLDLGHWSSSSFCMTLLMRSKITLFSTPSCMHVSHDVHDQLF
jgi:hypothetical protein